MTASSDAISGVFAGRYTIERELGRGATSVVYFAREMASGRAVAIKVLRAELVTEIAKDRFLREIRVTTRLEHPNIVPVLDSGEYDDRLFFVLPHMEGGTLRARLERDKQLPMAEVLAIGKTLTAALQFAHERKVLHRDVKPENILFGAGAACLADFGIARAWSEASGESGPSTTSSGMVRGTPAYMSPEQAAGGSNIDARSDIYSLACVLYEAVAGVPAFVGPTPQSILAQRLLHMPQPVRVYRPTVPPELEAVIERALATGSADRYQTAREFGAALESVEPILSRSSGVSRVSESPSRRSWWRPSRTVAVASGMAIIAAIALAIAWIRRPALTTDVPEGDPRRIAVMYLDDLTPSDVPTYVADGITEDLIDQLGAVLGLRVISPDGVRPFRRNAVPVDSIARSLKVGTIISGSIARYGLTLRVIVRLVNAATGQQLYSNTIEEKWTDVSTLQDSLADNVAFFLRRRLGEEIDVRGDRAATRSYAAWEAVQLGNDAARRGAAAAIVSNDGRAPALFLFADSLYARAEAVDRNWVRPTIKRGRNALGLAFQSPVPPNRADSIAYGRLSPAEQHVVWIRRAIELAEDALRRDRKSPDGLVLRGDARLALMNAGAAPRDSLTVLIERDLKAALGIRPNMARAWATLAQVARTNGQFAEAADAAKHGFEADAFLEVSGIASTGFQASLHAGEYADAQRWCRIGLAHYPGDPRFTECQLTLLGWTAGSPQDAAKAWRLIDDIERRDTLQILASTWGYRRLLVAAILARVGAADSARHMLAAVRASSSKRSSLTTEAYVQLLLGDRDGALATLSAYLRAAPVRRAEVAHDPWFQALHGDPRFMALAQGTP